LKITPELDDSKTLICYNKDDIGIFVYAESRERFLSLLYEQIAMLWQEYARVPDAKLSKEAQDLKKALKATFEEI